MLRLGPGLGDSPPPDPRCDRRGPGREQSPVRPWLVIPLVLAGAAAFAAAQVRPAVERIDAMVGRPLVLPVAVGERGPRVTRVALDDGHEPAVRYFRVEATGWTDAGWIGLVPRYRATPAERAGAGPGGWFALIAMPLEAVSQGLWFGSERFEVNWLPDPERAALEAEGRPLWQSPVPEEARSAPEVAAALRALAGDPFQAWRARLVRDGLAPTGGDDRTGPEGTDLAGLREDLATADGDRFLAELARHHEARWQLILGRMALIDPGAAERMRRRLGGVVRVDGRWLPMWAPDAPDLRALQLDLLSPWVDDETRVLRALGWLDFRPRALAWVIDDAGDAGPDESRLTATLGVLSLPARPAPLLVEVGGNFGAPSLDTAPSHESMTVRAGVPVVDRHADGLRTTAIPLRVGSSPATVAGIAAVPRALPPGVRIGPLLRAWTMGALLALDPALEAVPPHAATGVLRRGADARGGPGEGWSLYLECRAPAGAADAVTVWVGPYGVPRGVWRIGRDGSVHRLFGFSDLARVTVVPTADGWALDAVLPASAVDDDGVLRLGLTRELDGVRTSWPRRMTPGQDEPGRLPVDLSAWSGF